MSHQNTIEESEGVFRDYVDSSQVVKQEPNVSMENSSNHELLYVQLRRTVGELGDGAQRFFNYFTLSESVRMDRVDSMLKLLPPGVDLKVISQLPPSSSYEDAAAAFLRMLNSLQIVQNMLRTIDNEFADLPEEDKLFNISLKASLLCQLIGQYAFFWYNQLKLAMQRDVLFHDLKSVENEIANLQFPQRLRVMSKDFHLAPNLKKETFLKQELESFCENLDASSEKYRDLQRQLFNKFDVDTQYSKQTLPGFQELETQKEDGIRFFRMNFVDKIRKSVDKLVGTAGVTGGVRAASVARAAGMP